MDDCTAAAAAATEVNYICDGLVMNILSRLPLKTLFVCKCVSKSWHHMASTLVDSPKRPRTRPMIGLFVFSSNYPYGKLESIEFHSRRDDDEIDVNYSLNFLRMLPDTRLVDCQDGHLLYSSPNEYFVCNPITRQWVSLPHLREHSSWHVHAKLVLDEESDSCYSHSNIVQAVKFPSWQLLSCAVDVYCSQTGKWRESKALKLKPGTPFNLWDKPSVHVDGVVFFAGHRYLMYDIKEECLEELPLPFEMYGGIHSYGICMGKSEGRLHYAYPIGCLIRVWMMVGGDTRPTTRQWVLKHSVCLFYIDFPHSSGWPYYAEADIYAFHPNEDSIFIRKRGGDLFCYNVNTKALDKAATKGSNWACIWVYPFSVCLRPLVDTQEMTT